MDDGQFGTGLLSGLTSSAISSGVKGLSINFSAGRNDFGGFSANSFGRNAKLMKAIMIASGGLSGGVSSSIAGGNFWQGARQGLITSGLNHAAHWVRKMIQSYRIDGYLKQKGINPNDNVAMEYKTAQGIKRFIEKIVPLGFGYKSANSPEILISNEKYGKGYSNKANASYSPINHEIVIYQSSFRNYRFFALVIGHEIQHAIHHSSGLYKNWTRMNGERWAFNESEIRAYQWMIDYSSNYISAPWHGVYSIISFSRQRDFYYNLQLLNK